MPNEPQSSGEQNWWTSRGGEVYGPYDYQTVLFCRQDGRIVDDDYLKQGDGPWRRAADVVPAALGTPPVATAAPQPATPVLTTVPGPPAKRGSNAWIIWLVVGCGALMLLAAVAIFAAILFPVFGRAREKAEATACLANVKQLGVAFMMYTADYDQHLPEADSWEEAVAEYVWNDETLLTCPVTGHRYIFNEALSGVDLKDLDNPAETPMLWEPAIDAQGLVGPHEGQFNVCYADGHATMVDALPSGN